jgi:hypothetical protein
VINSRESGFSRILKSEVGYWVPETLVEQSKMRNGHGSGTQIEQNHVTDLWMPMMFFGYRVSFWKWKVQITHKRSFIQRLQSHKQAFKAFSEPSGKQ